MFVKQSPLPYSGANGQSGGQAVWPLHNGLVWKARSLLPTLFSVVFLGVSARSAASDTCGLNNGEAPDNLVLAVQKIQEGDYLAFISVLETGGRSPSENSLQLATDLEAYATDGFEMCTVAREDNGLNSKSYFLVFRDTDEEDERIVYVFFMLAKMQEEWLFLKTQVSTNFDEVYEFVR
jgi:hypothetical protein